MGLGDGIKVILQNADSIGVVGIVLILLFVLVFGVVTDRIHFGPEWKRNRLRCDTLEKTLVDQTKELIDYRVLSAESRVRIEFLELEAKRREEDLIHLKTRLSSVEAELSRIRESWTPPGRGQDGVR